MVDKRKKIAKTQNLQEMAPELKCEAAGETHRHHRNLEKRLQVTIHPLRSPVRASGIRMCEASSGGAALEPVVTVAQGMKIRLVLCPAPVSANYSVLAKPHNELSGKRDVSIATQACS